MIKRPMLPAHLPRIKGIRALTQVAIITRDTETMTRLLSQHLKVGAFKIFSARAPQLFNAQYGGQPENWSMKAGLTWLGHTQLEVIQPTGGRTVYEDYLNQRQQQAGIEHIYWDAPDFKATLRDLEALGHPLQQEAQLNAPGRIGLFPVPALPRFLRHLSARFGYTSTLDALKLDLEIAQFPKGVSQRFALRAAIAEQWIPADQPQHFESLPTGAPLSDLDAFYVLCRDLPTTMQHYAPLADRPLQAVAYHNKALPGQGQLAYLAVGDSLMALVQPSAGPLVDLLETHGEGLCLLGMRASTNVTAAQTTLQGLGWQGQRFDQDQRLFATHPDIPFGICVAPAQSRYL